MIGREYIPQIYFSDVFQVKAKTVDEYGAFDVALVNDLPLFVDPFLLFDSEDDKYKELHRSIIRYLVFLRDRACEGDLSEGNVTHWLLFKEVKQNWLGFSKTGNRGTGLGRTFANALALNLKSVFKWVFRSIVPTDSGPSCPATPVHRAHPFRSIVPSLRT